MSVYCNGDLWGKLGVKCFGRVEWRCVVIALESAMEGGSLWMLNKWYGGMNGHGVVSNNNKWVKDVCMWSLNLKM